MSRKAGYARETLLVGCLSHRIPRYSSTPQKLLSPPRPQKPKLRNSTCSLYLTLPPLSIPSIPSSSKPIPTPWGSPQLPSCPSWWSFSNRRLAPRYHTLALQCRYTKKPGKPDQTALPARAPPAPQKPPALPAKTLLGQTSSRPSTHRRPSSTSAVSLSLSIRPMAQSRTMESRVGRTKQRESHYPFLRGRGECRQIIWWVGGGAPPCWSCAQPQTTNAPRRPTRPPTWAQASLGNWRLHMLLMVHHADGFVISQATATMASASSQASCPRTKRRPSSC